jgi:DNA-directed RNA polymerase specialized sigma24 family protein
MDAPDGDQKAAQLRGDLSALGRQALLGPECQWAPDAKLAFDRVYSTFRSRMYAYVIKRVVRKLTAVDPDEFVPDMFMRFVRAADKFKPQNAHRYADLVRQFLTTLHQHARYMVLDLLGEDKGRVELLHSAVKELADVRAAVLADPSPQHVERLRRLEVALAQLDPRGRDVVVASSPYYDKEGARFMVPKEIRTALKMKWNLRTDNDLVQCRKRSLASLHKLIESVA